MESVANVNELLTSHVGLDLECIDRLYLNGYVPNLQVGGQVVRFLCEHLGNAIPSGAILERIGSRFRDRVQQFAAGGRIPLVRFAKGERKVERMKPLFGKSTAPGVVAIGQAQEFQWVATSYARPKSTPQSAPRFAFQRAQRRVSVYYFYILDPDWGPGFIKICSYFPYPIKVWLNGHEWAKQQAARHGIEFTELANGFASCVDPAALQEICDQLGPADVQRFFDRWMAVIPTPLTAADRDGGYWWELSLRQTEVSRTVVFDAPRRARSFFDALVTDNLDLGRPDEVQLIFDRRVTRRTPGTFSTRVVTRGVDVTVNVAYKASRIKEYLKEGRALRIETVINDPTDLGCQRRLHNLPELQARARAANTRLLMLQRVGQGCAISTALFERIALPSVEEGQRTGALRFGDPRVMALAGALCAAVHTIAGFTNRSLRARVAGLLGEDYGPTKMSYDLRRLRRKHLVARLPGTNTWTLTTEGARFALFYSKVHDRVLTPLCAVDHPPAPVELRRALRTIDHHINDYITAARLQQAA
jgi:hypothetical protein